jgi:hypothetical protein
MKDTIDRRAAFRVLASVPAWEFPVVAMATPVDPILQRSGATASRMSPSPPSHRRRRRQTTFRRKVPAPSPVTFEPTLPPRVSVLIKFAPASGSRQLACDRSLSPASSPQSRLHCALPRTTIYSSSAAPRHGRARNRRLRTLLRHMEQARRST